MLARVQAKRYRPACKLGSQNKILHLLTFQSLLLFITMKLYLFALIAALFQVAAVSAARGCFYFSQFSCTCNANVCSQAQCSSSGGLWSVFCFSCDCNNIGGGGGGTTTGPGCYDLGKHTCNCEPDVCSKETCETGFGKYWVNNCKSCQCAATTTSLRAASSDDEGISIEEVEAKFAAGEIDPSTP